MVWVNQQYLWMIISAAAVCVSCQELTSTLHDGNRACQGEEVTFTCTIRSADVTTLILAWSSAEYIGQGDPLRFITQDTPGTNRPSMIDGNVTAILTSNTNIDGVRTLVSKLHIVADQSSTVTCASEATSGTMSQVFTVSAIPGVPQRINARENSPPVGTTCIILVTWSPPTNSDPSDIDQYIVYVPSQNVRDVSSSIVSTFTVPNCGDDTRVQVAAVNRDGCEGMNSSEVQLILLDIPAGPTDDGSATTEGGLTTTEGGSTSSQLGAGAVVGIAIGVILPTLSFLGLLFVFICYVCIAGKPTGKPTEVEEVLLHEMLVIRQVDFQKDLVNFYKAVKEANKDKLSSVESLSQMMENRTSLSKRYIKEAVTITLQTIKWEKGEDVKNILIYLKENVPSVLALFDKELKDKDTDITMANLIRAAEQNEHARDFDELMEIMDNTKPEIVEGLLRTMFNELQTLLKPKGSSVEMEQVTNLPGGEFPDGEEQIELYEQF